MRASSEETDSILRPMESNASSFVVVWRGDEQEGGEVNFGDFLDFGIDGLCFIGEGEFAFDESESASVA